MLYFPCSTLEQKTAFSGKTNHGVFEKLLEFNKAALEVVRKYEDIQINDLYKVVNDSPAFDKWRIGTNVHYGAEQQPILGKAVADAVREAIQSGTGVDKK